MKHSSAKESARILPRKWIDEKWGFAAAGTQHDNYPAGRVRKVRPQSAPTTRRKDKAFVYHAYTGRRISPDQQHQQQQQQDPLRRRRPVKDAIENSTWRVDLPDSWGRGCGPSFAPKGVGPLLEPPRPPKGPTKPCWPTRAIGASALRYAGIVRREKGAFDGSGPPGEVPAVSWPEHAAMETGDVVVTIEHCHGCHRHRMTTRHDPEVYLRQANAVRELVIESLQEAPIRLAVVLKRATLRPKALPPGGRGAAVRQRRVGAFEVQVAARHPSRAHQLQVQVVHSKLTSGRWPRLQADAHLPYRVKAALTSWGFELSRRDASSVDAGLDGKGVDGEALSEQYRNPALAQISWEFDNRDWLPCEAAHAAVPSRESNTDTSGNPGNNSRGSNNKTREGQAATPASGKDDTKQTQEQAGPHGTSEDAGRAALGKRDVDEGFPSSGGSTRRGGSCTAEATANETTVKSVAGDGRDGGTGDGGGDGLSHASGVGWAVTAIDAGIGIGICGESNVGSSDNASAVAATATTATSSAVVKAPTTPPGIQRGGSRSHISEGKLLITADIGLSQSTQPAAPAHSSDGDVVATGRERVFGSEHDPKAEDLATSADVADFDRISTPSRSSRERRRQHGDKEDDNSASGCEDDSSETGCSSTLVRSIRTRQEKQMRPTSVGGAQQQTPRRAASSGCSSEQDDSEASRSRASKRQVGESPAVAHSSASSNSPIGNSRGSPKAVRETIEQLEATATTRDRHPRQEETTPPSRRTGADDRDGDSGTPEKGAKFAQPDAPKTDNQVRTPERRGTGDEGGGGDDSSGGSVASTAASVCVVKPTDTAATRNDPGIRQSGSTGDDVESRRSREYREPGERGGAGGEGRGRDETKVDDSATAGEGDPASDAEGDEYGSDFASQDASSIEEVDEGDEENAIFEEAASLVLPREDSSMKKNGEEFEWPDAEQKGEEAEEEVEEEDEYGDDFDDDGGEFD